MYNDMSRLYKTILTNFLKDDYIEITLLNEFIFENLNKYLKMEDIYHGVYVKEKVSQYGIDLEIYNQYIDNCVSFYVELCYQIKKSFDF